MTLEHREKFDYWEDLRRRTVLWRKQDGCTQKELADELGITQSGLSAFERGANGTLRKDHHNALLDIIRIKPTNIIDLGIEKVRDASEDGNKPTYENYLQNLRESIATKLCGGNTDVQMNVVRELSSMNVIKLIRLFDSLESDT